MTRRRPNLLFLFTDQQRLDTLACYGNDKIQMPNLNRFADEAVVFDQPHCTQPVCTPSRGSLMTGLWPHTHGAVSNNVPLRPEARCLPELLPAETRAAYRTAYMGKWHLGDEIFQQHGFDEWISIEDGYYPHYGPERDLSSRSSYHHFLVESGFAPARPCGGFTGFSRTFAAQMAERYGKPHFLGSQASAFIRRNAGRPWLLTVNFLEPHTPNQSCRDTQYDPADVDLPDNFHDLPTGAQPAFLRAWCKEVAERSGLSSEAHWREYTARYWGLNSLVDTHVGRILDALDASGQRDNTIIVFTSDHGEMLGSHQLLYKAVMFKESTRVPLLIQLPGQKAAGRISGPVSQVDLVPTLLELMGEVPAATHLPGVSLAGLCGEAASGQAVSAVGSASPCVVEWIPASQPCKATVRTLITPEGERYSHYSNGEHEFYDLESDPGETRNLAADDACQPRIRELCSQLAGWQQTVQDPAPAVVA
jgi:arylsulfatase A-like enzyme